MNKQLCPECIEAEKKSGIDIVRLLERLTLIKGNQLSDSEITYLCLSLYGYSNCQIAYKLRNHKIPSPQELALCKDIKRIERNMKSEMSDRVNSYIKELLGLEREKRKPAWLKVIHFLKKNGYTALHAREIILNSKQEFFILCEGDKSQEEVNEMLRACGMRTITIRRVL
ncbi:hypothetical protein H6F76_25115 [Leptolyngbya sp. FACHB-321]|uniref:hypothetical protein n=1 Tax=Leptolyngbya sp. FACHB-321 TaxID=2692807 RepID=UPI0016856A9E|nr:hypothetical protein [Leptolyngbya sp. FACHB-321]MBD2038237.1 hypothetical protein [Leptolyngbya sp. FACHB-321]